MNQLLKCTPYEGYKRVITIDPDTNEPFDHHNLVILEPLRNPQSRPVSSRVCSGTTLKKVTALPEEAEAREYLWERPILIARVKLPNNMIVDVINLHLKSRRPTNIQGHKLTDRAWKTASGLG